jgi:hypothetical protein
MSPDLIESAIGAWCDRDRASALLPADHEVIASTRAPRALVLELLARAAPERDLFNACAFLGRLIAERGGSPTLASATVDNAHHVLPDRATRGTDPAWLAPARAALWEGYVAARLDLAHCESLDAWEYPSCAVVLDPSTVAIVAGYPVEDGEAIAEWAGRVARSAARTGVRQAFISGREATRRVLEDALALVGVRVNAPTSAALSPVEHLARWFKGKSR